MVPALPTSFRRFGPPDPVSPVVVSVPHAGRDYPPAMLSLLTVPAALLTALEDRHVDAVALGAHGGETMLVAMRARGWIDLNRSPLRDRDPQVDAGAEPRIAGLSPSDKVRSGIGLIPRRGGGAENMWRRKLTDAEVAERITHDHAPYHAALAAALAAAHARFGIAILLDLHSMPPLVGLAPARIVLGDRYGRTAPGRMTDMVASVVRDLGLPLAMNHPYAGGYILSEHARPRANVHALQLEIDRSLYLDEALDLPGAGLDDTIALVRMVIDRLTDFALDATRRIAAE
ncbi:N-formylglutamate amidohydrolase [Sphingomonas sp. Leaf10]|nr:N-formylglutamate amidohydrolase [Sphingomonas sp. Leaf10]